jgi:hypothetical protein
MTVYLGNPQVIVYESFRVADHVSAVDSRLKRDQHIAGERPRGRSKVVPMRASHTSLKDKAHEDTSEFDRKFQW